ncbi:MAG: putative 4-hydroxybenzoate polyprenyltransferase [Bacteroidia bacterium]|nr:putative 4-hydroxybenzoate polyprenyltransferase [Bacteroidia bacterium]MDW8089213.1 UbiA-like polyprenyltransferase [Bacteroidia bacterium]
MFPFLQRFGKRLKLYSRLVVLEHAVFALPFALWGFAVGVKEIGGTAILPKLGWVLIALISARTAALAFNRYADHSLDAQNPRTAQREIPRGLVRPREALSLTLASAAIFMISAWRLNPLCGALAPLALFILLGYSYTKRFTHLSHYILGLALGLAPVGAYLAVTGRFSVFILNIGMAVVFWVAGFDILYALQDVEFDRAVGLHSIPARFGEALARRISLISHGISIILLAWGGFSLYGSHPLYWIGWGLFSGFVFYQHKVSCDKSRITRAFFTHNGLASIGLGTLAIVALWVPA